MAVRSSKPSANRPAATAASASSCFHPDPPKLNPHVERARRTHREEFYAITSAETTAAAMNTVLRDWENAYNHLRPHQPLDYQTPAEFVSITTPPTSIERSPLLRIYRTSACI